MKMYRTTYTVEVISEQPLPQAVESLQALHFLTQEEGTTVNIEFEDRSTVKEPIFPETD